MCLNWTTSCYVQRSLNAIQEKGSDSFQLAIPLGLVQHRQQQNTVLQIIAVYQFLAAGVAFKQNAAAFSIGN